MSNAYSESNNASPFEANSSRLANTKAGDNKEQTILIEVMACTQWHTFDWHAHYSLAIGLFGPGTHLYSERPQEPMPLAHVVSKA